MEKFKILCLYILVFGSCLIGEFILGLIYGIIFAIGSGSLYLLIPTINDFLKERKLANKDKRIAQLQKEIDNLKTEVV